MVDPPLCRSRTHVAGIWREYRVYPGRLELDTLLGTMVIPFEEIEQVTRFDETRPAPDPDVRVAVIERAIGSFRTVVIRHDREFGQVFERALRSFRGSVTDH